VLSVLHTMKLTVALFRALFERCHALL